jgi:hypothetical protein
VETSDRGEDPRERRIGLDEIEVVGPDDLTLDVVKNLAALLVETVRARSAAIPLLGKMGQDGVNGRRPWARRPPDRVTEPHDPFIRVPAEKRLLHTYDNTTPEPNPTTVSSAAFADGPERCSRASYGGCMPPVAPKRSAFGAAKVRYSQAQKGVRLGYGSPGRSYYEPSYRDCSYAEEVSAVDLHFGLREQNSRRVRLHHRVAL